MSDFVMGLATVTSLVATVCGLVPLWRVFCTTDPQSGLASAQAMAGVS